MGTGLIERAIADAYQHTVSSNVDIGVGDPVKLVSTGTVAAATAGDAVYGVISAVKQYWDGSRLRSGSVVPGGSTGGGLIARQTRVLVLPASAYIWEVDVDENTTFTTYATYQDAIGENADLIETRTLINGVYRSRPRLDISTNATTHSLVFRIEGISDTKNNVDYAGANVKLLVSVNKTEEAGAASQTIAGV
jgi:hypothetical protein